MAGLELLIRAGDELLDAVRARAADALVVVIAPVNAPREGYVVYDNTRRAAAGRRLDRTLTRFREAGVAATGHVVDNDPLTAVKDAIAIEGPSGPYANILAIRDADRNKPWVAKLVAAYHSAEVKQFIEGKFGGAVIAAW